MKILASLLFILCMLTSPAQAAPARVTVFAAASLRGALDAVVAAYDGEVLLSYGGSGAMARQVVAGAPADVVILASVTWMDWLAENATLLPETQRVLATNQLVVIGPPGAAESDADILALLGADGRLAMGQRDAVPAGVYAREWLQSTGQWDNLVNRLAETDNVRAALALVARGQAPVGVVYASDAAAEQRVRILAHVPSDAHSPIVYPAVALTPEGAAFLDHLTTTAAQSILVEYGFGMVDK